MSADKRDMHTDALAVLGNILTDDMNVGRDAIHLAVEPVVAGETLAAGEHIRLNDQGLAIATGDPLGIVDPFVIGGVAKGQKFFMVLLPRTITSLRHVWEHPAFTKPVTVAAMEQRLKEIAGEIGARPEEILRNTQYWVQHGDYWSEGSRWEDRPDLPPDFWDVVSAVGGFEIPEDKREGFFSCSC